MQPAPPAPGRGKWFLFGQIVFGCCKCSEGGRLRQKAKVLSDPLCGQIKLGGWKGGHINVYDVYVAQISNLSISLLIKWG